MRAAVYARVSSALQRDRQTIASQLRVLPDYARSRGWELVQTYADDGLTAKAGKLEARIGLAAMLRDAAARKFDVLVVIDIDRLSRSEDLTERGYIMGTLQRANVRIALAATGQLLDLNDSIGDLIGSIQAFGAADWLRKHRARIIEGKLTAIARGKKPAGPTPYGYRYDRSTGVWTVHDDEAAIIRELFDRTLAGETALAICEDLKVRGVPRPKNGTWTRERLYGLLKQTAYRGSWMADKAKQLAIATPPIVTDEVWNAVRALATSRSHRTKGLRRTKHTYLLEGLAVCALCGAPIRIASATPGKRPGIVFPARYVCARRRRPELGEEPCLLPYRPTGEVDEKLWRALRELVLVPGRIERAARKAHAEATQTSDLWRKDLAAAEKRIAHLEEHARLVIARGRRGLLSEDQVDAELAATKRDREQAEQQASSAQRAAFDAGKRSRRAAGAEQLVAQLRSRVDATSPDERRALLEKLLEPGSVALSIATIQATVRAKPSFAAAPIGLARPSDSSRVHEATLIFRLVA